MHFRGGPTFFTYFKMAASQGYQCEFIDSVFDDLYCKKCTLVARRLSITTCCMESFCHACIAVTQEEGKPCPACGKEDYNILERVKNQGRIGCLQAYCSMKEKGCGWSGTLEQLDTHLDPDQDNCQYVDTKCPLNCHMTIPRNKVEQHVAQHCAKRPYVCQHCNFQATYEEVVDAHLPECKYVPLQCPNLCGVTCEREDMEDHMKMCRLEEIGCEFSGVGCDGRFRREDQEEHTRQDSQKHLTLTASLAVETKEQVQQKLLEQDKKHKEEEEELRKTIDEWEKKMKDQLQQKLLEQDKKHKEEGKKQIADQETKIDEREKKMKDQFQQKLQEQDKKHKEEGKKLIADQETKIDEREKKMKDQLQQKLQEQDKKHKEEGKKLIADQETKIDEREKKMKDQLQQKLQEQDKKHKEEGKKLIADQETKIDEREKKMKDQLQQNLLEQDKKHKEEEEKLKKTIADQETKIDKQEKKMKEQKEMLEQQFNLKLQELKQILVDVIAKSNQNETKLSELSSMTVLNRKFEMKNFSGERAKKQQFDWKSPDMYTHVCGYKFCIIVRANGFRRGLGKSVYVVAGSMSGDYDDVLKWPVQVKITLQLINHQGGENACDSATFTWKKPTSEYGIVYGFYRSGHGFLDHSELNSFLKDDTLYFFVSEVELL